MPQRASRASIGTSVGKMIFHGQSAKRIERKLASIDSSKMKAALEKRGMGTTAHKEIAKVLAGESRSGWSQAKLRDVVDALQDVGLAKGAKSASEMVLKASRNAQADANPGLSAGAVKARLKGIARERRQEADAVPDESSMSVLDRMRGAAGRANKAGSSQPKADSSEETTNATVRQVRETMREDMRLRPKLVPPKNDDVEKPGFQA